MADLRWLADMDIGAAETDNDLEEAVQDAYHVIEQDLGSNPDDPTRGGGIGNILSKALSQGITPQLQAMILADDRFKSVTGQLNTDPVTNAASLDLVITTNDNVLTTSIPIGSTLNAGG